MEGWCKIKSAAVYAGVSVRTFRSWLKQGLKHSRLKSSTIIVKYSDIDDFLKGFSISDNLVDNIADVICKELDK